MLREILAPSIRRQSGLLESLSGKTDSSSERLSVCRAGHAWYAGPFLYFFGLGTFGGGPEGRLPGFTPRFFGDIAFTYLLKFLCYALYSALSSLSRKAMN